jgi:anti-sigma B factor antagonist
MQIQERQVGDVMILDAVGKMTLGDGDPLFKDKIHSLVHRGHTNVVLNLAGVSSLDSAGIGEIVASYTTLNRAGGRLGLLHLTKRIHDLLAITKLLSVFETYETEAEALRSFTVPA